MATPRETAAEIKLLEESIDRLKQAAEAARLANDPETYRKLSTAAKALSLDQRTLTAEADKQSKAATEAAGATRALTAATIIRTAAQVAGAGSEAAATAANAALKSATSAAAASTDEYSKLMKAYAGFRAATTKEEKQAAAETLVLASNANQAKKAMSAAALAVQKQAATEADVKLEALSMEGEIATKKKQDAADLKKSLDNLSSASRSAIINIVGIAAATAKFGAPVVFQQFALAMRDLAGVIGQILAPALSTITGYIRSFADYLINLDPSTKDLISNFAMVALRIAGLIFVGSNVIKLFMTLRTVLAALYLSIGVVGIVFAALAAILATNEEALQPILNAIGELFNALGPLVEVLSEALVPVIEIVASLITAAAWAIQVFIKSIQQLLSFLTGGFIKAPKWEFGKEKGEPKRSSIGAGGREVSLISGEEAARQILLAGATTPAEDYAAKTAKNTEYLKDIYNEMRKKVETGGGGGISGWKIAAGLLAGAGGFALGGPAGAVAAATAGAALAP